MVEWPLNSVITAHNLTEKPSNKALMGQVSKEKSLARMQSRWQYKGKRTLQEGGIKNQSKRRERESKNIVVQEQVLTFTST